MIKAIGTHIKVSDFAKSLAFYKALGFKKVFEYGPDKEVKEAYNGVDFEHNDCVLEIADGHRGVKPEVFNQMVTSSKISLMITVDKIQDIIEKCKQNNIPLAVEPRHYYWGKLEVVVKDPDGTVLVFVQPYNEEDAKAVNASEEFGVQPPLS